MNGKNSNFHIFEFPRQRKIHDNHFFDLCRYEKQLAEEQLDELEEDQRRKAEAAELAALQPDAMQAMEAEAAGN